MGNAIYDWLRSEGRRHVVASYGAHLGAAGPRFSWQGNWTLARQVRCSVRSAQRARRELEDAGLIRSCILERGQKVDGMRAGVTHPMVIRDCKRLHARALHSLGRALAPPVKRRKPSALEVSQTAETTRATPAEIMAVAQRPGVDPELAAIIGQIALCGVRQPPPDNAAAEPPTEDEIDAWDRRTAEIERAKPRASERGPPPRDTPPSE